MDTEKRHERGDTVSESDKKENGRRRMWTPLTLAACNDTGIDPSDLMLLDMDHFVREERKTSPKGTLLQEIKEMATIRYESHRRGVIADRKQVSHEKQKVTRRQRRLQDRLEGQKWEELARTSQKGRKTVDERVKATLEDLSLNMKDLPDWLDVDGDGEITAEELAPLENVLSKLAQRKKREDKTFDLKLDRELRKAEVQERQKRKRDMEIYAAKVKEQEKEKLRRKRQLQAFAEKRSRHEKERAKQARAKAQAKRQFQFRLEQEKLRTEKKQEMGTLIQQRRKVEEQQRQNFLLKRRENLSQCLERRIMDVELRWAANDMRRSRNIEAHRQKRRDAAGKWIARHAKQRDSAMKMQKAEEKRRKKIADEYATARGKSSEKRAQQKLLQSSKLSALSSARQVRTENAAKYLQRKKQRKIQRLEARLRARRLREEKRERKRQMKIRKKKLRRELKEERALCKQRRLQRKFRKRQDSMKGNVESKSWRLERLNMQKIGIQKEVTKARTCLEIYKNQVEAVVASATSPRKAAKRLRHIKKGRPQKSKIVPAVDAAEKLPFLPVTQRPKRRRFLQNARKWVLLSAKHFISIFDRAESIYEASRSRRQKLHVTR